MHNSDTQREVSQIATYLVVCSAAKDARYAAITPALIAERAIDPRTCLMRWIASSEPYRATRNIGYELQICKSVRGAVNVIRFNRQLRALHRESARIGIKKSSTDINNGMRIATTRPMMKPCYEPKDD